MIRNGFVKHTYTVLPIVLSGFLFIAMIFFLWQRVTILPSFTQTLDEMTGIFISISGFLAILIIVALVISAARLKTTKEAIAQNLSVITQKMHNFRMILELLLRSKIWLPGLKEYIDEEFYGLTFFEVKEFYKGKSKLAIEFLQETSQFEDTENLYLELKSLLMVNSKDKSLSEVVHYPKVYEKEIVTRWLEHKCGSGLRYYFGYKYGLFKEALDYNKVYERHQEKIMTLARAIDSNVFEDSSFNEVFLSKLGEYAATEIVPNLFETNEKKYRRTPYKMHYLYVVFLLVVLLGILLPIGYVLFALPAIYIVVSISFVCSIVFLISTTLYPLLLRETDI